MKKITVAMALIATIMIGCGGGSGGSSTGGNSGGTSNGKTHQPDNSKTNKTFKYPDFMSSLENFKLSYPSIHVFTNIEYMDGLPALIEGAFKADLMASTAISESPNVKHASCEKGSVIAQGLTHSQEYDYFSGGFIYKKSHGIIMELTGVEPECKDGIFKDGIISFAHNDESHTSGTFTMLIYDNVGYDGSFSSESTDNTEIITSPRMRIFLIPHENQEAYISNSDYKKTDDVTYTNYRYELSKSSYIKRSYTVTWEENSITFALDVDSYITDTKWHFDYNLYEKSNPDHFVKASAEATVSKEDGIQSVNFTYNKEGLEEHDSISK